MKRRLLLIVALIVVACVSLAASCNVDRRMIKKAEDLQEELCKLADDFNRMIAWRYYDEAGLMVAPELRADFLMQAEHIYARVSMEGYKISLCQVSPNPFPRQRGEVMPGPRPPRRDEATPTPEPTPEETSPTPKPEMPKKWYGLVLVRYINLSVAPSNAVRSPLIRQYWYWENDVWVVDPEIEQLLELNRPPQPQADARPSEQPIVPAP